jgi:hypothetical protein
MAYSSNKDHIWVSEDVIKTLDPVYADAIARTNASFDGEEVDEIYGWDEAKTFKEFLYLDYKFVTGVLYGHYTHGGPLVTEHADSVGSDLEYLVRHGVYTYHGQEPVKARSRSLLDFVVIIRDDIVPEFTKVLKSLYESDVNVFAEASKSKETLYKVLYATENDFTVMTDNYIDGTISFPATFKSWHNTVYCSKIQRTKPNSWEMTRRLTDAVLEDKKETHTRFHCEIWSPKFDGSKVEDNFIPLWKEFNSKYGHLNDC